MSEQRAEGIDERVLYFAFGANMCRAVLVDRRGITPRSSERARLPDHRLAFVERGFGFVEPAFASIVRSPGDEVHGVLHELTHADLERLDAREAAGYDRVEVEVVDARGRARPAFA